MNELTELCPICIEQSAEYFTECNHSFCIGCLSRINKCAMCRNPLQRNQLCSEIRNAFHLKYVYPRFFLRNNWGTRIYIPEPSASDLLRIMAGMPGLTYSN